MFYEHYTTSAPVGEIGETADRYGAAIGLRLKLLPRRSPSAWITAIVDKNSNLPDLDYSQNLVLLSVYYNF